MQKIPREWRKLSIKKRFEIPNKYFNLDASEIERIRNISDLKKRLVESAKLQYETFQDIHTDLTVWIAGYGSDTVVRQLFGSSKNLRELFIKQSEWKWDIQPSWQDTKRNITLPNEISNDLARETGIHIGDGNLYIQPNENYRYSISGDLENELLFHQGYIYNLMKRLYHCNVYFLIREHKNCVESIYKSKSIAQFKNKILGLPSGSKNNICIPKQIFESPEFARECILGIFDTDFSITSSMAITGKINSLKLVRQIHYILSKNNIKHIYQPYSIFGRFYINQKGAQRIIEEWGLKNPKHTSKYLIWKEFGKFIPFTTTSERLAILEEKLPIEKLEEISRKRKLQFGIQRSSLDSNQRPTD